MAVTKLLGDEELSPEAKAVFDDIRATRGSDFVNNVWRALAYDPPLLKRTWEGLKEVMMKPGALDLEKETILNYHREVADGRFAIQSLKIYKRLYIFGDPGETSPEPFIKDIVNPAIHTWSVTDVLSCA